MKNSTLLFGFSIITLMLSISFVSSFELNVNVPIRYLEVSPGEEVKFEIAIKNIESFGRKDIGLEYILKKGNEVIMKKREVKAVETQASFLGSITIPPSTKPGRYSLVVIINKEKSAENSIVVLGNKNFFTPMNLLISIASAILIVSLLVLWEVRKILKRKS